MPRRVGPRPGARSTTLANTSEAGAGSATFVWQNTTYRSFTAYRAGSAQDANSFFANPQFVGPGAEDFHLAAGSPAVNAGDPAFVPGSGETDIDGSPRVSGGRVDIGADEATCGDMVVDAGEQCDDGNSTNGDGCDNNCTATRSPDGLLSAKLKAGQTSITVKGKGPDLDLPPLNSLTAPVTVQFRRLGGDCWGARFSTPNLEGSVTLKARSD